MRSTKDLKPTWATSFWSPRPKGGEWVTKIRGFGRPTRPRHRILTESAFALRINYPSVERCAAAGVLRTIRAGIVVSEHVVERDAEKGDDVLEVIEGQVPAGDHRLDASGIGGQVRAVEHRLHPVADAEYLDTSKPITLQSIRSFPA